MNETHAAFDSEEQEILSQIVADEDGEMQAADETPPADTTDEQAPAAAQPEAKTTEASADVKPAEDKPAATPEKTEGNVSAALRASRRAEKRAKEELEKLRQENEQLRKAAPVAVEEQEFTPEELEAMKVDFPAQYKLYIKQQALAKQLAETRAAAPQPASNAEFQPIEFTPEVQELVDQVPDLLNWQHDEASQEKLQRAIAYDRALQADPDWAGKSLLERFTEAAERTKRAFGAVPPTPKKPAPAANRTDPAAAIAAIKPAGPKGISDFGGGQPASAPEVDFSKMSDEEIMARLPMTN